MAVLALATTDAYNIVDARIGWRNDNVELYAFAENLFDEVYEFNNFNAGQTPAGAPANLVFPGVPRIIGAGLTISFN